VRGGYADRTKRSVQNATTLPDAGTYTFELHPSGPSLHGTVIRVRVSGKDLHVASEGRVRFAV
jgi:hypothetical protein